MSNELKIVFDSLPPAELMPNRLRRLHWTQRAKATRIAREEASTAAYVAIQRDGWSVPHKAEMSFTFYVPDRRRRDVAEMVAACKAWVDGLVDCEVIRDDKWECLSIGKAEAVNVKGMSRTEIVIRRIEAQR
jgi:hypothetical protein